MLKNYAQSVVQVILEVQIQPNEIDKMHYLPARSSLVEEVLKMTSTWQAYASPVGRKKPCTF